MNNIQNLLTEFPELHLAKGDAVSAISYIQSDSRKIKKNDIFCLYANFTPEQKKEYTKNAIQNGATTILLNSKEGISLSEGFANILQLDSSVELFHGKLASYLKGNPSLELKIIAVTGTNGKTSTTNILYQLLNFLGYKSGMIGTIQIEYADKIIPAEYTTPDPSSLQSILKDMLDAGMDFVCMEASSHGLKLGRLEGVHLFGGIFTNLTPDHLDFHTDMHDYLLSKFHLFKILEYSKIPNKMGLIFTDSPGGEKMDSLLQENSFSYPIIRLGKKGDFEGNLTELTLSHTAFRLQKKDSSVWDLKTNLLGNFNFFNLSIALVFLLEAIPQFSIDFYIDKIKDLSPVSGRFEIVKGEFLDKLAIVDYAHTPDALENILKSVIDIPHSQIITVFGCGGDRDRKKRPLMAEIAARFSDFVIATSDNPRTENPETILDDVVKGLPKDSKAWLRIVDRKQAIKKGIEMLPENGILIVAGKGHENYQIIGTQKLHFSDKEEIFRAFQNLLL